MSDFPMPTARARRRAAVPPPSPSQARGSRRPPALSALRQVNKYNQTDDWFGSLSRCLNWNERVVQKSFSSGVENASEDDDQ